MLSMAWLTQMGMSKYVLLYVSYMYVLLYDKFL